MYLLYMFQYFSFIYFVSSMIKIIDEKDNHVLKQHFLKIFRYLWRKNLVLNIFVLIFTLTFNY